MAESLGAEETYRGARDPDGPGEPGVFASGRHEVLSHHVPGTRKPERRRVRRAGLGWAWGRGEAAEGP